MKKSFFLIMLVLGTVIGAGFASGKEICTFFVRFGAAAYALAPLSGAVLFFGVYAVLKVASTLREPCSESFHRALFGRFDGVGTLFSLCNAMLMTAAMLGAMQVLVPYGDVVSAVACFLVLLIGSRGVYRVNAVAVPLIIVLTLVVSFYSLFRGGNVLAVPITGTGGVLCAWLYAGMNLLTLGGVLCRERTTPKERLVVSLVSALVVTALIELEIVVIVQGGNDAYYSTLPVLTLASRVGLGVVTRIVMALGIFTTLCTCVYSESEWLRGLVRSKPLSLTLSLLAGILIARLGFDRIVDQLYPILGALGVVVLLFCGLCVVRATGRSLRDTLRSLFLRRRKGERPRRRPSATSTDACA